MRFLQSGRLQRRVTELLKLNQSSTNVCASDWAGMEPHEPVKHVDELCCTISGALSTHLCVIVLVVVWIQSTFFYLVR